MTGDGPGDVEAIVCDPYHAVPNFAKSLIVVARRGVSDAARRSIVSRGYEPCMLTERWREGRFSLAYRRFQAPGTRCPHTSGLCLVTLSTAPAPARVPIRPPSPCPGKRLHET